MAVTHGAATDRGEAVRRGRVRDRSWVRVSRGLYRPRLAEPARTADLYGWQSLLPVTGCFTHLTGALVRGWPVPPLPADLPVFAAICARDSRPRRPGLVISRHPRPVEYDEIAGLRVARPAHILVGAARDLGLLDVLLLVDAALHRGECTLAELHQVAAHQRGGPALRTALRYADGRAESPWETVLRLLHQVCDVPVEPQYGIGPFSADLRIVGTRRLAEYDGEVHRTADRHAKDLARERQLHRLGWQRYGYTSRVILHNGLSVLRDADEALGRPHEPERIRAWHRLLAESLFTPAGTARARGRWAARPRA
ncbi:hypothetical protein BH20ACT5_BH20ACT5_13500 [soil metagenome]